MSSPILHIAVIGDAQFVATSRHHVSYHEATEAIDADIVISSVARPNLQRTPQLFILTDTDAELPTDLPYRALLSMHRLRAFYVATNELAATMLELLLSEHGIKTIAVESPTKLRALAATLQTLDEATAALRDVLSEDDVHAILLDG